MNSGQCCTFGTLRTGAFSMAAGDGNGISFTGRISGTGLAGQTEILTFRNFYY